MNLSWGLLHAGLQTVLDTIVARATQLSGTEAGVIYVFDEAERAFQMRATYGMTADMIAVIREHHADFSEAVHAATQRREPNQVADLQPSSPANELIMRLGYRARLVVPLLAPDAIVGALVVRRKAPGEFPKNTIELLLAHGFKYDSSMMGGIIGPIASGEAMWPNSASHFGLGKKRRSSRCPYRCRPRRAC